ncbi:protein-export chaperone SecB [Segnochrobactrum spirostomi]|uniref:Protein-export protein SecB n=1 Tax=Segnochrobactrum spirostomi TaxID=2608987 RepID=A0A6A7Y3D3_9HYPH|nr:protein-export chaperone SecB [Segnochrobactrum spirostomi]MQT12887.1 protein-export chaperone SecB [Segnochrobactrum spirostomi]
MSDTENGGVTAPPSINVLAQYLKDFSFENPKAPLSLQPRQQAPAITVNVNVNARALSEADIEVTLLLDARAGSEDDVVFHTEIAYAGIFRIQNVPGEHLQPLVMIECPRLLFPFARQIVADATRNGGFPPLLIDPIDFVALYQQNIQRAQAAAVAAGAPN